MHACSLLKVVLVKDCTTQSLISKRITPSNPSLSPLHPTCFLLLNTSPAAGRPEAYTRSAATAARRRCGRRRSNRLRRRRGEGWRCCCYCCNRSCSRAAEAERRRSRVAAAAAAAARFGCTARARGRAGCGLGSIGCRGRVGSLGVGGGGRRCSCRRGLGCGTGGRLGGWTYEHRKKMKMAARMIRPRTSQRAQLPQVLCRKLAGGKQWQGVGGRLTCHCSSRSSRSYAP